MDFGWLFELGGNKADSKWIEGSVLSGLSQITPGSGGSGVSGGNATGNGTAGGSKSNACRVEGGAMKWALESMVIALLVSFGFSLM
jgi:hypothetical protein